MTSFCEKYVVETLQIDAYNKVEGVKLKALNLNFIYP